MGVFVIICTLNKISMNRKLIVTSVIKYIYLIELTLSTQITLYRVRLSLPTDPSFFKYFGLMTPREENSFCITALPPGNICNRNSVVVMLLGSNTGRIKVQVRFLLFEKITETYRQIGTSAFGKGENKKKYIVLHVNIFSEYVRKCLGRCCRNIRERTTGSRSY